MSLITTHPDKGNKVTVTETRKERPPGALLAHRVRTVLELYWVLRASLFEE